MPTRLTVTKQEIENGLRNAGIREGDTVLLHSSVWSMGIVEGGPRTVIDAFFTVLGKTGTLAVPAFGDFGAICRLIRNDPRAIQSIQLPGRIAAIGPRANELCHDHHLAKTAHGENTPYTRLAEAGGWVCLLGVDQDRNTTLHSAEALLQLPYLSEEVFEFQSDETARTRTFRHYPGPHRDFIGLDRRLRKAGITRIVHIGQATVRTMKARELIDFCQDLGEQDPTYALCKNPNCADCVSQRATIRRHRLKNEPFILAASASLAGRYVPEMIENLNACGLRHIELDLVQATPLERMEPSTLCAIVEQLTKSNIAVTALRTAGVPAKPESLCRIAKELAIPRLVIPLTGEAEATITMAQSGGLDVLVSNVIHGAAAVGALFDRLEGVGLAMSPCAFARCGENPFLNSLNESKARRYLKQLDVEDCLFDGTPAALGHGNAEIKELVSILRCGGFDGTLVLSSGNRSIGTLKQIVEQFDAILDEI